MSQASLQCLSDKNC